MKKIKVSPIKVVRNYYVSDVLMKQAQLVEKNLNNKDFEKILSKIVKESEKIDDIDLINYFSKNMNGPRFDNYFNSSWVLKEISLSDCGVWPKAGDLPEEATYGNVLDTVNYIMPYLKDKSILNYKMSRVLYIENMLTTVDIIAKYLPIIVLEDQVIRNHKWKHQKINKYAKCKYDIEDGSHRAIALSIKGTKNVFAYVGKKIYKSPELYY